MLARTRKRGNSARFAASSIWSARAWSARASGRTLRASVHVDARHSASYFGTSRLQKYQSVHS